jgi:tetratricopeptide (TPR) repeat protein
MTSAASLDDRSGDTGLFYFGISVLLCLVILIMAGCAAKESAPPKQTSETERQIEFYRQKIAASDKHYPSYGMLAEVLLRRSRETGDHSLIAEARHNAEASMAIQPNYLAMKAMAMICNHTHRFADALSWADKAAGASAEGLAFDTELTAIVVEAHLGLGEIEKAAAALEQLQTVGKKQDDYYTASARGGVLKAQNKVDEAVKAFEAAREFAAKQGVNSGVVWANVMAAGCLLDSGRAAEAEPYLKLASAMEPTNTVLAIHQAEFLVATGQAKEALKIYNELLRSGDDAEIHRRAFVIARDLGDKGEAERHFEAAQSGFLKVVDMGEIFTLGPLAQLYCDAGTEADKARQYARQNWEFKRDAEAQATLACVDKMGG